MFEQLDGWMVGWLDDWKTGRLEDWKTGRLDNWKTGWLDGWMRYGQFSNTKQYRKLYVNGF